jgi:hypothetical protein
MITKPGKLSREPRSLQSDRTRSRRTIVAGVAVVDAMAEPPGMVGDPQQGVGEVSDQTVEPATTREAPVPAVVPDDEQRPGDRPLGHPQRRESPASAVTSRKKISHRPAHGGPEADRGGCAGDTEMLDDADGGDLVEAQVTRQVAGVEMLDADDSLESGTTNGLLSARLDAPCMASVYRIGTPAAKPPT